MAALCLGAAALIPAALPPGTARAQAAPEASVVGKPILPTARASVDPQASYERSAEDMAAAQAALPATGSGAGPALPLRPTMDPEAYRAAKRAADEALSHAIAKPTAALAGTSLLNAPTTVIVKKPGPNQTGAGNGGYPPDTTGAIGPSEVVYTVNQTINVYSRKGVLQKSTGFGAFFGTSDLLSDPRVVYDTLWNRWVVTDTRVPPASGDTVSACFWIAVSKTAKATGAWYTYRSCSGGGIFVNGDLWDYDQLGITQDAILVTGNIFGSSGFKGAAMMPIPKAEIYNGFGWSSPIFTLPTSVGTIAPPVVADINGIGFFLAIDASRAVLDLYRGTELSDEYQASFVLQAQIAVPTYGLPPNALQPGTSQVLDTLDGRFQNASTQYSNSLWNVHTVIGTGARPMPIYYQIDTNANTVIQSGALVESSTSNDFNPSVAANSGGDAFFTWSTTDALSSSGGQHNAAVRFSGRLAADPLGAVGPGSVLFTSPVALTGDLQNGIQRWGDYSRVALDPVTSTCGAGKRAAVFNETILDANDWSTEYGLIGFCR